MWLGITLVTIFIAAASYWTGYRHGQDDILDGDPDWRK